ncbi:MAG TPA: hypothetical protein PK760_00295 [Flavobacteriales bacterium]|nr:hypothetical protein [Flavobacteriales bacterium]
MNTNWSKILLFTLLGFALGYIVCCLTCGRCGGGSCERDGMECHGGMSMCDHGGSCCSGEGSHCDKEGCDHKMGAACCKGHMEGKMSCCKGGHGMGHGDDKVQVIVSDLEKSNFQGDTTIIIDGGTVNVHRMGDSTEVKVEMKKEESVTVHAH